MLFAVLSGFIAAILCIPFGSWLRGRWAVAITLLPLGLLIYFAGLLPQVAAGEVFVSSYSWVPSMDVNLSFRLDGLSMMFALLITGIAVLVFGYAASYLKGHPLIDRFYAYLSLFMAAMLGLVLADNILLLFIFWELTSISSFFLIGFHTDNKAARKSALLALGVTGGGGFLLMAGLILMGSLTGTNSISELLSSAEFLKNHASYGWILGLVFMGAFTKSAQFPFHFWLPGAMKAPTPVSAYLHSATMVKAGIYLLARLFPLLGGTNQWFWVLVIVGGFTMVYAAFHSIFRTDLKGILAYSTISALGMMVFLLGLGTQAALLAVSVFIVVHALYKASLFLIAGAIDHATGTRDVTKLAGLGKVMPVLAVAGLMAALSSAGLPFTLGFIGKDLIYEATLHTTGLAAVLFTVLAVVTNIFLLYAGFLAGIRPFVGKLPEAFKSGLHLPSVYLWAAPLLLGVAGILFGMFPALLDDSFTKPMFSVISGAVTETPLKIWHGVNLVLLLSAVTLLAGTVLYLLRRPAQKRLESLAKWDRFAPVGMTARLGGWITGFSGWYTRTWHNGYLRTYLLTILLFSIGLLLFRIFTGVDFSVDYTKISPLSFYEVLIGLILVAAVFLAVTSPSRLTAVVAMSVVGYCICLFFVFYGAPDLAMTQFTIDTLTVVLFVLVLFRLPPFLNQANNKIKIRDGLVAVCFGTLVSLIALQVLNGPVNNEISDFYGDNAYKLAKGKNVVNVILVDFRGFDTLFEIVVLSIAAVGVYSLLKLRLKTSEKE